jgi:hypothetical protein
MTELITRLYTTDLKAEHVVAGLRAEGFPADRIMLVPAGSAPAVTAECVAGLAAATSATVLSRATLNGLAEGVERGAALVGVSPPFGAAYTAEQVMDSATEPTALAEKPSTPMATGDDPAPLSEALHVPVLIGSRSDTGGGPALVDDPAPLSSALHVPVLIDQTPHMSGNPKLVADPAPLSSALGLPVLSSRLKTTRLLPNDWSLSRLLGLPLLTKPSEASVSHPAMPDNPAPLSSKLGLPVLTKTD